MVNKILLDVKKNKISWLLATSTKGSAANMPDILNVSELNKFQPTPTKQKELLPSMILTLTENEFNVKHIENVNLEVIAETVGGTNHNRADDAIKVDEENGVIDVS